MRRDSCTSAWTEKRPSKRAVGDVSRWKSSRSCVTEPSVALKMGLLPSSLRMYLVRPREECVGGDVRTRGAIQGKGHGMWGCVRFEEPLRILEEVILLDGGQVHVSVRLHRQPKVEKVGALVLRHELEKVADRSRIAQQVAERDARRQFLEQPTLHTHIRRPHTRPSAVRSGASPGSTLCVLGAGATYRPDRRLVPCAAAGAAAAESILQLGQQSIKDRAWTARAHPFRRLRRWC